MVDQSCADSSMVEQSLFQAANGGSIPTSALQLTVTTTSAAFACKLNEKWHSRLPRIHPSNVIRNRHSICFVAWYGFTEIATAIWSSPVAGNRMKNGEQVLELRRLAIGPDAPHNTATRMLSLMRREIFRTFTDISLLISYQDTEVHKGTIYKAAGWKPTLLSNGKSWGETRDRNADQSTAPKLRWEYRIRPDLPTVTKKKEPELRQMLFDEND